MERSISLLVVLGCVLCIASCTGIHKISTAPSPAYWPTEGWLTSPPEKQGMDSRVLTDMLEYVHQRNLNLHSLLIVRHGYVVLDAYFYPYSRDSLHDVASVTKSVTTSLVGIALEKGFIKSVKQPVLELFPDRIIGNLDEEKKRITIEHLLSMTSGLECGYEPGEKTLYAMLKSDDWVQFVLDLPMAAAPGTRFAYCSPTMHLLSVILKRTTGTSALEFAHKYLFGPLGIRNVDWPSDPQGINHGWGDLRLHPHDMAKIGFLFLNNGTWDGRHILSPDWIRKATRKHIDVPDSDSDYGYGWWVNSTEFPGLYEAVGRGGQSISIWPDKDVVVVFTAGGLDRGEIAPLLVSALKSDRSLKENPDAYGRLQERVVAAAKPPDPKPVPPLPGTARRISGRMYELEPNPLGVKSVFLSVKGQDEALFGISLAGGPGGAEGLFRMPVGLDGVYRISKEGPSDFPVAVKGFWRTENEFVLSYNEVARINNFMLTMTFEGDNVIVRVDDPTHHFDATINGRVR